MWPACGSEGGTSRTASTPQLACRFESCLRVKSQRDAPSTSSFLRSARVPCSPRAKRSPSTYCRRHWVHSSSRVPWGCFGACSSSPQPNEPFLRRFAEKPLNQSVEWGQVPISSRCCCARKLRSDRSVMLIDCNLFGGSDHQALEKRCLVPIMNRYLAGRVVSAELVSPPLPPVGAAPAFPLSQCARGGLVYVCRHGSAPGTR
jgi:hypothetical protein